MQEIDGQMLAEFVAAWVRLKDIAPTLRRKNKRGQWEEVQEVRVILRRKRGQWLCVVGGISRTGSTEAEAMSRVVAALEQP